LMVVRGEMVRLENGVEFLEVLPMEWNQCVSLQDTLIVTIVFWLGNRPNELALYGTMEFITYFNFNGNKWMIPNGRSDLPFARSRTKRPPKDSGRFPFMEQHLYFFQWTSKIGTWNKPGQRKTCIH
jgi:hypothetical protein